MIVGILRETFPGERRVAIVPAVVPMLGKSGLHTVVQAGAGEAAGFRDAEYESKGAKVAADRAEVFGAAEIICQVRTAAANPEHGRQDLRSIRPEQILVGLADPLSGSQALVELAATGAKCFALELLPRITRAQSMDVLSSQANVAGYKAVLLAAASLPRLFPMMMTAAGTISPARVFVIGAGVAGLQAVATAKRLGAVVRAYDVRPAVKEQVESLGARFVQLPLESAEGAGGYAKAMDEAFYRKQRELMAAAIRDSDVVICTAAVPGTKPPILITTEMVSSMSAGSVIVDLVAGPGSDGGGNCELTKPDQTVDDHGVTIAGPTNLAATVPQTASHVYARNIAAFVQNLVKDKKIVIDLEDQIVRETLVCDRGEVVHPRVRGALGLGSEQDLAQRREDATAQRV